MFKLIYSFIQNINKLIKINYIFPLTKINQNKPKVSIQLINISKYYKSIKNQLK